MGRRQRRKTKKEVNEEEPSEKKKASPKKEVSAEGSYSFKDILAFFKTLTSKKYAWIIMLILLLIPLFTSVYYRAYPFSLPATDDWARSSIEQNIKGELATQLVQQFPNLPSESINNEVNRQYVDFYAANKAQIEQQITGTSNYFKSRLQDETGQTYLLAIDPYLWYGQSRNIINTGGVGDTNIDGVNYETRRNGRREYPTGLGHIPLTNVIIYHIVNFLGSIFGFSISILTATFLTPLVISTLAAIPCFFLARRFGGNIAGFFAAMMLSLHPAILSRTVAGFSDNDPYNIFFPMLCAWLVVEALYAKTTKNKIIMSVIASAVIALYSFFWVGWWHMLYIIGAGLGVKLLIDIIIAIIRWKETLKDRAVKLVKKNDVLFYFLGSILIVLPLAHTLWSRSQSFIAEFFKNILWVVGTPFSTVLDFVQYKVVVTKTEIWPNVLTTVAELNIPSFQHVLNSLGTVLLVSLAALAPLLVMVFWKKETPTRGDYIFAGVSALFIFLITKADLAMMNTIVLLALPTIIYLFAQGIFPQYFSRQKHAVAVLILLFWFLSGIYGGSRGMRFIALAANAYTILAGLALGIICYKSAEYITKSKKIRKYITIGVCIILFFAVMPTAMKAAHGQSMGEIPSFDDAWYESLIEIRDDADDGIISSWWDFGHWFVTMGERRVTFDGGDQGKRIHWIGKSLLTPDESQSVDILRMLNCDQNGAYEKLFYDWDLASVESVDTINTIIAMEKAEAKKYLEDWGKLSSDQIEELLEKTHCNDLIPQYYITSSDMIGKAGVWGHFGSWDFNRAQMFQDIRGTPETTAINILVDNYGLDEASAGIKYDEIQNTDADAWVSPWPSYITHNWISCTELNETVVCPLNLNVGSQNGVSITLRQAQFPLANLDESVLVMNFGGQQEQGTRPSKIVYADKTLEEIQFDESGLNMGFLLQKTGDGHRLLASDPLLIDSVFTQLYYLDGVYSRCFEKLGDRHSVTGTRIVTWKVDFSCSLQSPIERVEEIITEEPEILEEEEEIMVEESNVENHVAVIETNKGIIKFELLEDKAPITTANFIKLANAAFYDGITFHRYVEGFVIQGGDPITKEDPDSPLAGSGGSDENIPLEIAEGVKHDKAGMVAMARSQDPDSASSQFYFTLAAAPHLDNSYALFGEVVEGLDVLMQLRQGDVMQKVYIE